MVVMSISLNLVLEYRGYQFFIYFNFILFFYPDLSRRWMLGVVCKHTGEPNFTFNFILQFIYYPDLSRLWMLGAVCKHFGDPKWTRRDWRLWSDGHPDGARRGLRRAEGQQGTGHGSRGWSPSNAERLGLQPSGSGCAQVQQLGTALLPSPQYILRYTLLHGP